MKQKKRKREGRENETRDEIDVRGTNGSTRTRKLTFYVAHIHSHRGPIHVRMHRPHILTHPVAALRLATVDSVLEHDWLPAKVGLFLHWLRVNIAYLTSLLGNAFSSSINGPA